MGPLSIFVTQPEIVLKTTLSLIMASLLLCSCSLPEPTKTKAKQESSFTQSNMTNKIPRKANIYRGQLIRLKNQHLGSDAFVLILDKEIKFPGDNFVQECRVHEIQLCEPDGVDLKDYLSRPIAITGKLFGEHTAHHIRRVLVDEVRILRPS